MNMKKKNLAALLMCAEFALLGCSGKNEDKADALMKAAEQSLYERGLGLASEIYEYAASKELLDFMMGDYGWEAIQSEGAAVKKSDPTACYELRPDYESFISSSAELAEWYESLSPAVRKRVEPQLLSMFNYNMNVRGATYIALGAVLTATALFDSCGGFHTPTLCVVIKGIKPDCDTL